MLLNEFILTGEKVLYLAILIIIGMIARRFGLLSDKSEKDISRLMIDLFWPALIFYSVTNSLSTSDIVNNSLLPVFAIVMCTIGLLTGLIIVKLNRYTEERKAIFLYHSLINNYVFMVLPFAMTMLPRKGAGLLFIHNLGMILMTWVIGVPIITKSFNLKQILKNMTTPGLISTFLAIIFVLTGLNKHIPTVVNNAVKTTGEATIIISMLIVGNQIYKIGIKSLKFDAWNIQLAILRLIIIPAILFLFALLMKFYSLVSNETLVIFLLVNCMPVSLNSVSMAIRYNNSANLATQGVLFTHLFSIITILVNVILIKLYF